MTFAQKHALLATVIWSVIFAGLIAVVLGIGVDRFDDPEQAPWRLMAAAVILPGFILNAWLGWRSKQGHRRGELDERDDAVALNASQVTLIVVTVVVYLASLILYETHYRDGAVPAGWLYLIAYGTVCLVSLVHAASSLLLDMQGTQHG
jgi:hypothetical protein